MTGRGSWSTIGGTVPALIGGRTYGFYQLTSTLVGQRAVDNPQLDTAYVDYRAVNLAVKGYQRLLNAALPGVSLVTDGVLGPKTDEAIKAVQLQFGMEDLTPGRIGHTLSTRLLRDLITHTESVYGIPGHALYGVGHLESDGYDLGCVGTVSDLDKGIFQFHCAPGDKTWWNASVSLPEVDITPLMAFDPYWAVEQAARRMAYYRSLFSKKGRDLQLRAGILQHNAPGWAQQLYSTEQYPNSTASAYVTAVLNRAAGF